MSRYEKIRILDGLEVLFFEEGNPIVTEGEPGTNFYIIEDGSCSCFKNDAESGEDTFIRDLDTGDYFGEIALSKPG